MITRMNTTHKTIGLQLKVASVHTSTATVTAGTRRMKPKVGNPPATRNSFTVEQHLQAQAEIERRAFALWQSGGCLPGCALADWLSAEREVLAEFCLRIDPNASAFRSASSRARSRLGIACFEPT